MIGEYEEVAKRAFEEPYFGDLRDHVRVCGDHFESHGDPRGTLIALGEARYDATGRRAHDLQREIDAHAVNYHAAELGAAAELIDYNRRQLVIEWRCGRPYAALLDTRNAKRKHTTAEDMVRRMLAGPAIQHLRRLTVRVRRAEDVDSVTTILRNTNLAPPLEHLFVIHEVRPRRLSFGRATLMTTRYPHLYLYAERDAILSLALDESSSSNERLVKRMLAITPPFDRHSRILIGRALTSSESFLRDAALARIGQLGDPAAIFVDTLALLLQPGLATSQLPILLSLHALGRAARGALPVLVKIPGRAKHYDRETRSAAGQLVGRLR